MYAISDKKFLNVHTLEPQLGKCRLIAKLNNPTRRKLNWLELFQSDKSACKYWVMADLVFDKSIAWVSSKKNETLDVFVLLIYPKHNRKFFNRMIECINQIFLFRRFALLPEKCKFQLRKLLDIKQCAFDIFSAPTNMALVHLFWFTTLFKFTFRDFLYTLLCSIDYRATVLQLKWLWILI